MAPQLKVVLIQNITPSIYLQKNKLQPSQMNLYLSPYLFLKSHSFCHRDSGFTNFREGKESPFGSDSPVQEISEIITIWWPGCHQQSLVFPLIPNHQASELAVKSLFSSLLSLRMCGAEDRLNFSCL